MTGAVPFLFAADLDGTLLPNTGQRPDPGCLERTWDLLCALQAADCPTCYVTGRHLSLARQGTGVFRLPFPAWWVCSVGTEIYDRRGRPDPEWRRRLGPELDREALCRALSGIPFLTLQGRAKQRPHKLSFYSSRPVSQALRWDILACLETVRGGLRLVVSVEDLSGRGLLDILPAEAGKACAVRYLAERYGLPAERVFFAGDSGNDLDALLSGVCGTLVGNTSPEVREQARRLEASQESARLYLAEACYGDAVIEGLRHYGLWSRDAP